MAEEKVLYRESVDLNVPKAGGGSGGIAFYTIEVDEELDCNYIVGLNKLTAPSYFVSTITNPMGVSYYPLQNLQDNLTTVAFDDTLIFKWNDERNRYDDLTDIG